MILLIVVVGLLRISLADEALHCVPMPDFPDFDMDKFTGIWYEQAKYFDRLVAGVKCITSTYASHDDDLTVRNAGINATTEGLVAMTAVLTVPVITKPSRFKVAFPTKPAILPADYWIVSTDYKNYGIVFACNKVRGVSRTRVWLLTRVPNPPATLKTELVATAERLNIQTSSLIWTDQINCENHHPEGRY